MIRGIVIALAFTVVAGGGLVLVGKARPDLPVAGKLAEATGVTQAEARDTETGGGGGLLARVLGPAAEREDGGSGSTRVYYQYVDENGQIHFAQNLSQVPVAWRDKAGRIEMKAAPKTAATSRQAPAKPARRPFAYQAEPEVTIFTAPWCGWCRKTLAHLDGKGVEYVNKDIDANPAHRQELQRKTGSTSIPVMEIGGELVRGYNPARIDQLLN